MLGTLRKPSVIFGNLQKLSDIFGNWGNVGIENLMRLTLEKLAGILLESVYMKSELVSVRFVSNFI